MEILFVILVCLLFSAFFSGTEIAFNTANKLKIEVDKSNRLFSARLLSRFTKTPSNLIVAILLGNNIALVVYGIFTSRWLTPLLEQHLPAVFRNDMLILILQTLIATLIILIFAEFLPKILFRIHPNRVLSVIALPITVFFFLLYPLVFLFISLSEWILRLFSPASARAVDSNFSPVDIDHYISEFNTAPKADNEIRQEIQMVQNVMDLKNVKVRECMVPRMEIIAADVNASIAEIRQKLIDTGLSKILLFSDTIDNGIGYLHAFDLFKHPERVQDILRPISIVPETMLVNKLLKDMIDKKRSIALVVDEFGGTSGLVTLEDLMEEIFGEIEDEFDTDDSLEKQISENSFIFSARAEIDHLNEQYSLNLPEMEEYETLAGMITHFHESIPRRGEEIWIDERIFVRILQASETRVEKVMLTLKEE